jgi:hypothetical protein
MTEEQKILAGQRVEAFLADSAVIAAFKRLDEQYAHDWKASNSREEREVLHAKARALDDIAAELRGVVNTGVRAKVESDRRNAGQSRQRNR